MIEEYLLYKIAESNPEINKTEVKTGVRRFLDRIWDKCIKSYIENSISSFKENNFYKESLKKFKEQIGDTARLYTLKTPEYKINDNTTIGEVWGNPNFPKYEMEIKRLLIANRSNLKINYLINQNIIEHEGTLATTELEKVLEGSNLDKQGFLEEIKTLGYDKTIIDDDNKLRYLSTTDNDIKLFKSKGKEWKEIPGIKEEFRKTILGEYNGDYEVLLSSILNELYGNQQTRYCTYCNNSIIFTRKTESGLDRLDSSLNYLENNLVFACPKCNTMKSSDSPEDFIDKVNKIHENIKDKTQGQDLQQYLSQSKSVITDTIKKVKEELSNNLSASAQRKYKIKNIIKVSRYNQLLNLLK